MSEFLHVALAGLWAGCIGAGVFVGFKLSVIAVMYIVAIMLG